MSFQFTSAAQLFPVHQALKGHNLRVEQVEAAYDLAQKIKEYLVGNSETTPDDENTTLPVEVHDALTKNMFLACVAMREYRR